VEDLRGVHKSVLRNPLIGNCFFLIKFIEQWGTGTNRIINSCLSHGLPEPLFRELSGGLVVGRVDELGVLTNYLTYPIVPGD
jgi:ATP-dependent DNA helicase RecG